MPPIQGLASQKLDQQRLAANTPMECPRCHGIFFYWADCAQYSNVGYGSAEFKMLTPTPQRVLLCLCGRIMKPATAPIAATGTTSSTFYQSILAADKYQSIADANGIRQALAKDFVGTAEFNSQAATIEENLHTLQEQITAIEEARTGYKAVDDEDAPFVTGSAGEEVTHDGKPVKVKPLATKGK
jgi:hypothetical protein